MRIIKKGKLPEEHIVECPYCNTVFAYTEEDVEVVKRHAYTLHYLNCPFCEISLTKTEEKEIVRVR